MNLITRLLNRITGGSDDEQSAAETPADEDSGQPNGSERRPADPPTEPMGASPVADGTVTMQSHGSHWDTVLPDDGTGTNIDDLVFQTVKEGEPVEGVTHEDQNVTGYIGDGEEVKPMVVTLDSQVATAYPRIEGVTHEFSATQLNEWNIGIEAWIGGDLGPAGVTAFATNYFEHPPEHFGGDCSVSLALSAYDFGESDYDTIVGEDGEELDVSDFVGFRPWERGAPDDYVVRTKVKETTRVEHGPIQGYLLRVPLFRPEGEAGPEFDVNLFVADHVAGEYEPNVGDSVEGACWLQAEFN
ncbi:hypothetical protein [Haloferax sp. DFSO60]|uniref:hypothetical protein n=1 Tax=Haloferax sp. DFSO60 TaxID=3388652 RepID=UPI0039787188